MERRTTIDVPGCHFFAGSYGTRVMHRFDSMVSIDFRLLDFLSKIANICMRIENISSVCVCRDRDGRASWDQACIVEAMNPKLLWQEHDDDNGDDTLDKIDPKDDDGCGVHHRKRKQLVCSIFQNVIGNVLTSSFTARMLMEWMNRQKQFNHWVVTTSWCDGNGHSVFTVWRITGLLLIDFLEVLN